ncbi:trypsin-like serine peptidase [Agrobacterium sp. DKPNP3]|uniref:trypsin-like serine peptidase n=1 Tax=Agrobacterium sp. DKPNP3 TaxID=3457323 RepID=UPI004044F8CD
MNTESCGSVADAIEFYRPQSESALLAVRGGRQRLTIGGLLAAAEYSAAPDPYEFAEEQIANLGLDIVFIDAMRARGVSIGPMDPADIVQQTNFDHNQLGSFLSRAGRQKCRIDVMGMAAGSGCLIGPSLVLTAWHVIRNADDGRVQVRFRQSDGAGRLNATIGGSVVDDLTSQCSPEELDGKPPLDDAGYHGFNDVAVIRLDSAEGKRVGFLDLPGPDHVLRPNDSVCLMHYPQGEDVGVSFSSVRKIRRITARWKYGAGAMPGSSGGPCVNTKFVLAGIHQGNWGREKRLVPTHLFLARLADAVANDLAPTALWSLDDTLDGRLVIARDQLFEALAAANRPRSWTRGIRIKRTNLNSEVGLNFSLDAISAILARDPKRNVVIRISFEGRDEALFPLIIRALEAASHPVVSPPAMPGADHIDTTLEATINETARMLAANIESLSEDGSRTFWFLFENAPGGIRDILRYQFEAFFAATVNQPNLRIIIAGFETISTPVLEESTTRYVEAGPVHVVIDYMGEFTKSDVATLFRRAGEDLKIERAPGWTDDEAADAVAGLVETNGRYDMQVIELVTDRARVRLKFLKAPETASR